MKDRECSYCIDMFDCKGKEEGVSMCNKMKINPNRAEAYREWVEERCNSERERNKRR